MKTIFFLLILAAGSASLAQSDVRYQCLSTQPLTGVTVMAASPEQARELSLKILASTGVQNVDCKLAPPVPRTGTMDDLSGRRWISPAARGEAHLLFEAGTMSHVQDCIGGPRVTKYTMEKIGQNIRLTEAGVQGECNPYYNPGFKTGSEISIGVLIYPNGEGMVLIHEKPPGEDRRISSMYRSPAP